MQLVQDKNHNRKYLVIEGVKHWLPDSETRNALGYNVADFLVLPEEGLTEIPDGNSIDSVKSMRTRLVRSKERHNDVFIVFQQPDVYRMHIPDQATLDAMGRRQDQVEVINDAEMQKIEEAEKGIRPVQKWDTNRQRSSLTQHFHGPVGVVGSNKGASSAKQSNPVLKVTGNDNKFDYVQVHGPTEVGGNNNLFTNTKIGKFIVQQTSFVKGVLIIVFGGVLLAILRWVLENVF